MKFWLLNIGLYTSLLLIASVSEVKAEKFISPFAPEAASYETDNNFIPTDPGFFANYIYHLTNPAECLPVEEISVRVRLREVKVSFIKPVFAMCKKLICVNKNLHSGTILKESFAINHIPFTEMLFDKKHCIYGFGQQVI